MIRVTSGSVPLLFLYLAACTCTSAPLARDDERTQQETPETSHGEAPFACPAPESLCPMIYRPARCWLGPQDKPTLTASGSNSCVARLELHRLWCQSNSNGKGGVDPNGMAKDPQHQQLQGVPGKADTSAVVTCADEDPASP